MSAMEVTISGVLYDRLNRTTQNVVLIGEATLTGLGVGGGPIIPPEGGGEPPGIWPSPGRPAHPIAPGGRPPGIWGPTDPFPTPPIVIPPEQLPPNLRPPQPPPPGSPTTPVPPPEGSAGWPVNPVTPPAYLVVNYPGIGPVYVAPPAVPQPKR